MTAPMRYIEIENTTGAVFTPASALTIPYKEGGLQFFKRKFAAIDVGTTAGKTQDTTNPAAVTDTKGVLLVTLNAGLIRMVPSLTVYRPTATGALSFDYPIYDDFAHTISHDKKSLYLFDDATTHIAAGDYVIFSLIFSKY